MSGEVIGELQPDGSVSVNDGGYRAKVTDEGRNDCLDALGYLMHNMTRAKFETNMSGAVFREANCRCSTHPVFGGVYEFKPDVSFLAKVKP